MQQTDFRARIERISHKMLDTAGAILDGMIADLERRAAPEPAGPLAPEAAQVWRWTNDHLQLWKSCEKPACRRARCCKREPRACLTRHAPQIPPALAKRAVALLRAHFSDPARCATLLPRLLAQDEPHARGSR